MALKSIGYDNTAIKNQTIAAGDTLEIDGALDVAEGLLVTTGGVVVQADGLLVTGNSSITGNLTVSGNLISQDQLQVLIKDNFLDLNVGYVGTSYEQTGLTFNYQAVSGKTFTVDSATNNLTFSAGNSSVRGRLTLSGSVISGGTFAAGDILQISGTTDGENDGIYVVHDQSTADSIFIKTSTLSVPDTVNSAFALLNFTAQTQDSGTVTISIVNLMALRASSSGELQSAAGDSDSDFSTYSSVGAATTLQEAYEAGNSITTASSTNILFTLTSGNFVVQGDGLVDFGSGTSLSAFNLDTSGAIAIDSSAGTISLDAGAASNFTTSAGVLTLSGAGGITNTSTGGTYTVNATGQTVDINATVLDVDTTGNISLNSSGATAEVLAADEIILNCSAGAVDIDAVGNVEIDATSAVSIQGATTSDFTVTGNTASATDISISTDNNGSGAASIGLAAKSAIINTIGGNAKLTINSASTTHSQNVVFDSTGGFKVNGETVTINSIKDEDNMASDSDTALATQQSIKAYVDAQITAQDLDFSGDSGTGAVDLDSQTLAISGVANETVTTASGQTLTVGLADAVQITTSLEIGSGGATITEFSTDNTLGGVSPSNTVVPTELAVKTYVDDSIVTYNTLTVTTGENVSAGDLLSINSSGAAVKSDASTAALQNIVGFAVETVSSGNSVRIAQVGTITNTGAYTAGTVYYASATAGGTTSTAPNTSGDLVYQVGYGIDSNTLAIHQRWIMLVG